MGKVKAFFMELREKEMSNYPLGAGNDPNAPWNQMDHGTKQCPDCLGIGNIVDYDEVLDCPFQVQCETCEGRGYVYRTREDQENDHQNEVDHNYKKE